MHAARYGVLLLNYKVRHVFKLLGTSFWVSIKGIIIFIYIKETLFKYEGLKLSISKVMMTPRCVSRLLAAPNFTYANMASQCCCDRSWVVTMILHTKSGPPNQIGSFITFDILTFRPWHSNRIYRIDTNNMFPMMESKKDVPSLSNLKK